MKNCPKCQASVSEGAKFCIKCGFNIKKFEEERAQAEIFCPECGTKFSGGDFCPECGYNVVNELNGVESNDGFDTFWLSELEGNMELAPFEYEAHNDGTYTITGLKDKTALNVVIPKGVVDINDGVFENCRVINASLPDGLLQIGNRAFKGCENLSSINLPESLMIVGEEAFMDCIMLDIELPSTIRRVGKDAMKNTIPDKKRQEEEARKAEEKRIAEEKARKAEEKRQAELKKWDAGTEHIFGSYYQSNSSTKEPIEWIVLTREGDKALLISKYALDCKPYNTEYTSVTWENCTPRKWLNNEFINNAFNSEEKGKIQNTRVNNPNNPDYGTNGGNATNDKIFLLSIDEARKYFATDKRKCKVTAYAKSNGANDVGNGYGYWWRRSPGYFQTYASYVDYDGSVFTHGSNVSLTFISVRPALWIKL